MLEGQENLLRSKVRRLHGELVAPEVVGGNYSDSAESIYMDPIQKAFLNNRIDETEMVFYACQCLNSMKVIFSITVFKRDALDWCLELKYNANLSVIEKTTWEDSRRSKKSDISQKMTFMTWNGSSFI